MTENPAGDGIDGKRMLGRMGLGALALGAMTAIGTKTAQAATYSDSDILNFALNLEYLEAEYYLRAATGTGLADADTTGTGTAGSVTGGGLVPFVSPAIQAWAERIASDELAHVNFLRGALSTSAVVEPAIDFVDSFSTLAIAAKIIPPGETFNPFESEINFLLGAYIFEDVGVTAYAGAANKLTVPANIAYGASILGTEGYQVGLIRSRLSAVGAGSVTDAISSLRSKLSDAVNPSAGVDDNGTDFNSNPYNFTNVDTNSQAYRRTPAEVLAIAYGAANASEGGFFPNGVNGVIKTSSPS